MGCHGVLLQPSKNVSNRELREATMSTTRRTLLNKTWWEEQWLCAYDLNLCSFCSGPLLRYPFTGDGGSKDPVKRSRTSRIWCLSTWSRCLPTYQSGDVVQAALRKLEGDADLADRTTLTPVQIADVLDFVFRSRYFQYNGSIYKRDGAWGALYPRLC